jgi:hypothetical protein
MIALAAIWSQIVMAVNVDWGSIIDDIQKMFMGNGIDLGGIFGGSTEMTALFVFLFFFIVTLLLGLGMLIGSVIIIPATFAIFQWIPSLKIIVGIMCGLIFGFALQRMYRR